MASGRLPQTFYRIECICGGFSVFTNSRYEAQKVATLHRAMNADVKMRPGEVHSVKVTSSIVPAPRESPVILEALVHA